MRCKTLVMNTLQGEIGVPLGWSSGASGVVDRSPWGGNRVLGGSEGGAPGCRAGAGEVGKGAFRAGNRRPAGCRVGARRLAADAPGVAGRSLGVHRRSLRGTAGMLGAAVEGPEGADDQPEGCDADARSCECDAPGCGGAARLSRAESSSGAVPAPSVRYAESAMSPSEAGAGTDPLLATSTVSFSTNNHERTICHLIH